MTFSLIEVPEIRIARETNNHEWPPTAAAGDAEIITLILSAGALGSHADGTRAKDLVSYRPTMTATIETPRGAAEFTETPVDLAAAPIATSTPRQPKFLIESDDLRAFLTSRNVQELHVPDLNCTPHRQVLVNLLRGEHPLQCIVIETMRFDLADTLEQQLAQLVLVLAAHQQATTR